MDMTTLSSPLDGGNRDEILDQQLVRLFGEYENAIAQNRESKDRKKELSTELAPLCYEKWLKLRAQGKKDQGVKSWCKERGIHRSKLYRLAGQYAIDNRRDWPAKAKGNKSVLPTLSSETKCTGFPPDHTETPTDVAGLIAWATNTVHPLLDGVLQPMGVDERVVALKMFFASIAKKWFPDGYVAVSSKKPGGKK